MYSSPNLFANSPFPAIEPKSVMINQMVSNQGLSLHYCLFKSSVKTLSDVQAVMVLKPHISTVLLQSHHNCMSAIRFRKHPEIAGRSSCNRAQPTWRNHTKLSLTRKPNRCFTPTQARRHKLHPPLRPPQQIHVRHAHPLRHHLPASVSNVSAFTRRTRASPTCPPPLVPLSTHALNDSS